MAETSRMTEAALDGLFEGLTAAGSGAISLADVLGHFADVFRDEDAHTRHLYRAGHRR